MNGGNSGTVVWMRVLGIILLISGIDYFLTFLPASPLTSLPLAIGALVFGVWGVIGFLPDKYVFAFRLILGATFIYAAVDKIIHPYEFAKIIYYYKILPGGVINILALLLPWLELITGVFLIVGFWHKSSAVIVGSMLVVFLVALTSAYIRGIDISCGCFSTTSRVKSDVLSYIFRDIVLIAAVALILAAKERFLSISANNIKAA